MIAANRKILHAILLVIRCGSHGFRSHASSIGNTKPRVPMARAAISVPTPHHNEPMTVSHSLVLQPSKTPSVDLLGLSGSML